MNTLEHNNDISSVLSILIPVFNEEMLLPRAIESAKRLGVSVFILDSGSTDDTVKIAKLSGCVVHQGLWGSFSEKLNWGLNELPFQTPWVMRLDADEYLTEELIQELLAGALGQFAEQTNGVWVKRRIHFLGRWVRYGGMNSQPHVRIVRVGKAQYEQRLTDEHILAEGEFGMLRGAIVDDPARGLVSWLGKHVAYAETECFAAYHLPKRSTWRSLHGSAKYRRFIKEEIYANTPLFIRPVVFWVYRYFFLLGFLDGIRGLIYHFLHAFWYRFVIDALIFEARLTKGASVKKKHVI